MLFLFNIYYFISIVNFIIKTSVYWDMRSVALLLDMGPVPI